MIHKFLKAAILLGALVATPAWAQDVVAAAAEPDSGDTAWILTSSALVLMMTIPGLALFYGGLVRSKNFLSVLVQCGAIAAITSVLWIAIGYSLAFSTDGGEFLGSAQNFMFNNMLAVREGQSIGELVFGLFQMTFAVITPALIVGAWSSARALAGSWRSAHCGRCWFMFP